jgi:hypothetical protein
MSKTTKTNMPTLFHKGERVRNVFTGAEYIVKCCQWQWYDGQGDYTVEFEPAGNQPTPWDKSQNLERG